MRVLLLSASAAASLSLSACLSACLPLRRCVAPLAIVSHQRVTCRMLIRCWRVRTTQYCFCDSACVDLLEFGLEQIVLSKAKVSAWLDLVVHSSKGFRKKERCQRAEENHDLLACQVCPKNHDVPLLRFNLFEE